MHLRSARPDDADAVADVARESWHAAYGDFLSTVTIDETVDEWYAPEALRDQVGHGSFWVAVDESQIVGFAHAFVGGDGTRPTLGRLYVRETEWGNGVGTALLNRVVAALDTDDTHDFLSVIVFATNPVGRDFYESRGFEVVGRRTETFDGNDHEELILRAPLESFPVGR